MRGVTIEANKPEPQTIFQLTRLMRGVTGEMEDLYKNNYDFNSHASCEA